MEDIGITQVTVTAGRSFCDPQRDEMFCLPEVTLTADINPRGECGLVVQRLQALAENLVEEHCTQFLELLEQRRNQQQAKRRQDDKDTKPPAGTVPFWQSPPNVYPPPKTEPPPAPPAPPPAPAA